MDLSFSLGEVVTWSGAPLHPAMQAPREFLSEGCGSTQTSDCAPLHSRAHSLHWACSGNRTPPKNLYIKRYERVRQWLGLGPCRCSDRRGACSHGLALIGSKPADKQIDWCTWAPAFITLSQKYKQTQICAHKKGLFPSNEWEVNQGEMELNDPLSV